MSFKVFFEQELLLVEQTESGYGFHLPLLDLTFFKSMNFDCEMHCFRLIKLGQL